MSIQSCTAIRVRPDRQVFHLPESGLRIQRNLLCAQRHAARDASRKWLHCDLSPGEMRIAGCTRVSMTSVIHIPALHPLPAPPLSITAPNHELSLEPYKTMPPAAHSWDDSLRSRTVSRRRPSQSLTGTQHSSSAGAADLHALRRLCWVDILSSSSPILPRRIVHPPPYFFPDTPGPRVAKACTSILLEVQVSFRLANSQRRPPNYLLLQVECKLRSAHLALVVHWRSRSCKGEPFVRPLAALRTFAVP